MSRRTTFTKPQSSTQTSVSSKHPEQSTVWNPLDQTILSTPLPALPIPLLSSTQRGSRIPFQYKFQIAKQLDLQRSKNEKEKEVKAEEGGLEEDYPDYTNYKYWSKKIWMCIYIIGDSFDLDRDVKNLGMSCSDDREAMIKSFACFFTSLSKLLPKKEARDSLSYFLTASDPIKYLMNKETLLWTFKFHCFVNSRRPKKTKARYTYDEICEIYEPQKISKTIWGNLLWFLIHFLARCLPQELDQENAIAFKALMVTLQCLLPCGMCRNHLHTHLSKFPIDDYLYSRDTTFEWTVDLHNQVNLSIGKEEYSLAQARKDYLLPSRPELSGPKKGNISIPNCAK